MTAPAASQAIGSAPSGKQQDPQLVRALRPDVVWLVDNDDAYSAIASAVATAEESISISQLAFDADFCVPSCDGTSTPFIDLLLSAARERGVQVRILLNATLLIDTLKPLQRFLDSRQLNCRGFELRGVSFFPHLLHAKTVIVDSKTAFLVGSPFVNGYWDSSRHAPLDERRPRGELGGRPLHDVSVQLFGTPVKKIDRVFNELWNSGEHEPAVARPMSEYAGTHATGRARIYTTAPGSVLRSRPLGSTEILRSIERTIAGARTLIYIEQQYLSSRRVFTALQAALTKEPELEVIIVSNQNPDITAYAKWQLANLREFGMLEHPRVGIFTLWSAAKTAKRMQVNQVFVHSKVLVVDNACAICGSANMDGVSLHSYGADFSGIGRRIFHNVRNFDINVTVTDDDSDDHALAASLQHALWSEHLGEGYKSAPRPAGGWLAAWREIARSNITALQADRVPHGGAFILPFIARSKPSQQLRELGVDAKSSTLELLFNPGWFERRFNLRWVRNMFL